MTHEIDSIIKLVRSNTKESYKCVLNEANKPVKSIANFGLKKDQVAIKRDTGEYAGMSIKATEDIFPILTDRRIIKALKLLKAENIQGAISVLGIGKFITIHGIATLYYTLHYWLSNNANDIKIPTFISNEYQEIDDENLDNYIDTSRHDPVDGSFTIHSVGQSTSGNTVVPTEWLNKEFPNATALHKEMDKLDWRIGKPPVSYAIIYSIRIVDDKQTTYEEFIKNHDQKEQSKEIIYIHVSLHCSIFNSFKNVEEFLKSKKINSKNLQVISHEEIVILIDCEVLIKYTKTKILKQRINTKHIPENQHYERVGYLVSCLQKCIRRGSKNSELLLETIYKLNQAPPYNLPEQQYIRVSGSKQLVWRLFITTIEDSDLYEPNENQCSLLDLLCYTLACHYNTDLQFSDFLVNKIAYTALNIQYNTNLWPWRTGQEGKYDKKLGFTKNTEILDALKLALKVLPMMQGDNFLLNVSINYINDNKIKFKQLPDKSIKELLKLAVKIDQKETLAISNDMHCTPNLLIYVQGCLNYIPTEKESTKNLSKFIWDTQSSINIRENTAKKNNPNHLNKIIYHCQANMYSNYSPNTNIIFNNNKKKNKQELSTFISEPILGISRLAFLLVFGEEITLPGGIIISFTDDKEKPFKFKKRSDTKFIQDEKLINKYTDLLLKIYSKPIKKILPGLPGGYSWKNLDRSSNKDFVVNIQISKDAKNNYKFLMNDITVDTFNGLELINKDQPIILNTFDVYKNSQVIENDPSLEKIVSDALYVTDNYDTRGWDLLNILYARGNQLRKLLSTNLNNVPVLSWLNLLSPKALFKIPTKVWQNVYVRLLSGNSVVNIYQVDRGGKKLLGACDYIYEGCVLRIMLLLNVLYPLVVIPKTSNFMSFLIYQKRPEYVVMISTIKSLMTPSNIKTIVPVPAQIPKIITNLWDHQKLTRDTIYDGLVNKGKKGYGDAASVGSGKTLTTISIMTKLLSNNKVSSHNGFLVLVPNMRLIDTWTTEIKKHTTGFRIITQQSNGTWKVGNLIISNNKVEITINTIAITTLGRARDKPKDNSWILVIIDECLSVQNSGALQTEAAFRQIMLSQYGVIMLSATFFRARFDKLFFMLKMLQSGFPENRSYLSTIINEHVFCHVSESTRKWITTTNEFTLDTKTKLKYENVRTGKLSVEKKYQELLNIVITEFDINGAIKSLLVNANKEKRRCLIYARSKAEADNISKLEGISRYPEKKHKHIVVSYQEGTFGLNDLTDYDTIITRMNHLDIVIQQKGRLDRPGQKSTILHLNFILVANTVDEAWKLKFEMTNGFYTKYLLPLSDFYKLAIAQK